MNIGFEKGTVLNLEQMIDYAEGGVEIGRAHV